MALDAGVSPVANFKAKVVGGSVIKQHYNIR